MFSAAAGLLLGAIVEALEAAEEFESMTTSMLMGAAEVGVREERRRAPRRWVYSH